LFASHCRKFLLKYQTRFFAAWFPRMLLNFTNPESVRFARFNESRILRLSGMTKEDPAPQSKFSKLVILPRALSCRNFVVGEIKRKPSPAFQPDSSRGRVTQSSLRCGRAKRWGVLFSWPPIFLPAHYWNWRDWKWHENPSFAIADTN